MNRLLPFALLAALNTTAQWSTDPASPMVVSAVANAPRYMAAIADADSGYYAVWSDLRNDPNKGDLYGQHFDSEGNALWTAGGRLLLSNPTKSINQVAPQLMPDGSLMVAYMTRSNTSGGDTIRAMRFDETGNPLWIAPSVLLTGFDYRSLQVIPSDSAAFVVAYCESCTGGYGCKMQRVRMDGSVQFPLPELSMGSNYFGPYTIHPDGAGGILFTIRCANGSGTCLKAQRFDSLGTEVWPNYIDLADADGLYYAFATTMDGTGALTAVWEVSANDLRMHRMDTLGNSLWSPAVQVACDLAVYVQQDPAAVATSSELFVAWEDNRPPAANSDLYIQKYDLSTGAELWATDGVLGIQTNTYIPSPGLVLSDSGAVVATFDGNIDGYSAMRVRNDGTQAWPEPVVLCVPSFNPFYERRVHLQDGNGGVVAFWEGSFGGLYGARVYRNGKLYNDVGIDEAHAARTLSAYPNPTSGHITFNLPANERLQQIEVIGARGEIVLHIADRDASPVIDTHDLSSGLYVAIIRTATNTYTARFSKQ